LSLGSTRQPPPPGVFLDVLDLLSVLPPKEIELGIPLAPGSTLVAAATSASDWTEPYVTYLENKVLPEDETEARMIQRRCKSFVMIDNELYKCSVIGVFQRCISLEEGCKILYDIHVGDCGHHAGARSLVAKALRHGFY
jgi:hypothetical protein